MLEPDPHVSSPVAQAQELLGSKSPWADVTKLAELQIKCKGVPADMIWCLQGVNSLLHRALLPADKLSYRDLQGSKWKRSILLVLVFKRRLNNYLLGTLATQTLKLDLQDVNTLCEALKGFASFDQMTDNLKVRLKSMSDLARQLASFIGKNIYGVGMDQSLMNGTLALPSADEWVLACPELQSLVAAVAPRGHASGEPVLQGAIAVAGDVPHICSIALPWLTANKEQELPADVKQIIDVHKVKVAGLLNDHVRVLDAKVADDTFCSQLPHSVFELCALCLTVCSAPGSVSVTLGWGMGCDSWEPAGPGADWSALARIAKANRRATLKENARRMAAKNADVI